VSGHLGKAWGVAAARTQLLQFKTRKGCSSEEWRGSSSQAIFRVDPSSVSIVLVIIRRGRSSWTQRSVAGHDPASIGGVTLSPRLASSWGGWKRLGSQEGPGPKRLGCRQGGLVHQRLKGLRRRGQYPWREAEQGTDSSHFPRDRLSRLHFQPLHSSGPRVRVRAIRSHSGAAPFFPFMPRSRPGRGRLDSDVPISRPGHILSQKLLSSELRNGKFAPGSKSSAPVSPRAPCQWPPFLRSITPTFLRGSRPRRDRSVQETVIFRLPLILASAEVLWSPTSLSPRAMPAGACQRESNRLEYTGQA
jgi:hypothetical protein